MVEMSKMKNLPLERSESPHSLQNSSLYGPSVNIICLIV